MTKNGKKKNGNLVKVPRNSDVKKAAEAIVLNAEQVLGMVESTTISTPDQASSAVHWLAEIKIRKEEVDAKRRSFTDPLRETIDRINAEFRPALEALESAEKGMKDKVSSWTVSLHNSRDALLEEAAEAGSPEKQEELIEKAESMIPPKIPGMSVRENWKGVVTNEEELITWAVKNKRFDLLQVNTKALLALTKASGRDPKIPGWTPTRTRSVAITPSRISR